MAHHDPKTILREYLDSARAAMRWKLDGAAEYDVRRPMTSTGTNLLGLVKHLACVELGYFGDVFDRPHGIAFPGDEDEPNADMYASADESRADILGLYDRATAHGDRVIAEFPLDHVGRVPWWPEGADEVTLQLVMVHLIAETNRHVGHADIIRETIDGAIGHRATVDNLPDVAEDWWPDYVRRVDDHARGAER